MQKLNNVMLTVSDITGWQTDKVASLTSWINAYANLLGQNKEERAINCIKTALILEGDFTDYDVKRWVFVTINLIFHEIMQILSKNVTKKHTNLLVAMQKQFAPHTDSLPYRFCNVFDCIDFEQDRDSIIEQAKTS